MLRLGPLRRSGHGAAPLPLVVDVTRLESVPPELIKAARAKRLSMEGFDEVRIQREVRDELFRLRTAMKGATDLEGKERVLAPE
jgi:hypothetical protein